MTDFSSLELSERLLSGINDLGFTEPTPIQRQAIPPALEGRDVLACAMTGSGKTAAFLLPILQRLESSPGAGTRALIVTPTRELAAQIGEHFQGLGRHTKLRAAAVYGGVSMVPQERAFRQAVDVLIATPGRLLDHLTRPYANLDSIEVLVLDEADRMLDMGFLPDVRRILSYVPKKRQTLFFSATMPPPIAALAQEMLVNPVGLNVERRAAPATMVTQMVFPVPENQKPQLLLELLNRGELENALVFTRTKHRANRLSDFLGRHGVSCDRLHGNRSQAQRTEALASFKEGRIRVLVATDIAARGIDVEALPHVVNFDVPNVTEDYIHRVGRTARAGASGDAFTFFSPEERNDLNAIERAIGSRLPQRKLEGFPYGEAPTEKLEIPIAERIAAIRARKAEERARAAAKAQRKAEAAAQQQNRPAARRPEERRPQPPQGSPSPGGNRPPRGTNRGNANNSPGNRAYGKPGHGAHQPGNHGNFGNGNRAQGSHGHQGHGNGSRSQGGYGNGNRAKGAPGPSHLVDGNRAVPNHRAQVEVDGNRLPPESFPQPEANGNRIGVGENAALAARRPGERRPSGLIARPHPRYRD